jgi:predicted enzyme related to lactoylglutathione lyase
MTIDLLVNIDVDNLEKAIGFYGQAFDLHVARRFGNDGAEMLGGSSALYLLVKAPGSKASAATSQLRDYQRHWTPVHLDFVVEDIRAAVQKAEHAGAELEGSIQTYKWGRIAHMADPFGHGICLLEFIGGGYDEIAS